MIYINELEELEDILDQIEFEDEPSIFTEECTLELIETVLHLMEIYMEENPTAISEPDFQEVFLEEIKDMFYTQFEDHILSNDDIEDDMNDLLEDAFSIYITTFHIERSFGANRSALDIGESSNSETMVEELDKLKLNNDIIQQKIEYLRTIPQPTQRTPEWYKFRHNLITASNAHKAFDSQSTINQLIYEKCQPLKTGLEEEDKPKSVNINTPLHWGQKYEPISVLIYEDMYKTQVEDFGCIQHKNYTFLGASPDGIVVDPQSDRYGRMLEIKNVVNREITGIPKKEYWVQTQLQMEVCDLDQCDFLETKFTEYPDSSSFFADGEKNKTEKGEIKGSIMYFNTSDSTPFYLYKPLSIIEYNDICEWEEEMVDVYQSKNMIWIKNIYWKLEKLSCVLILRNKDWFKNNIFQLERVWKIIESERITGYEHRAPNRKPKKESSFNKFIPTESQGCLLHIIKKNDNLSIIDNDNTNN